MRWYTLQVFLYFHLFYDSGEKTFWGIRFSFDINAVCRFTWLWYFFMFQMCALCKSRKVLENVFKISNQGPVCSDQNSRFVLYCSWRISVRWNSSKLTIVCSFFHFFCWAINCIEVFASPQNTHRPKSKRRKNKYLFIALYVEQQHDDGMEGMVRIQISWNPDYEIYKIYV